MTFPVSHIEIEGKCGWIIGGGGGEGMLPPPPLKLLGGAWPPCPHTSSYAYDTCTVICLHVREIIHSLKLVDSVQADKPWYNYYMYSLFSVRDLMR